MKNVIFSATFFTLLVFPIPLSCRRSEESIFHMFFVIRSLSLTNFLSLSLCLTLSLELTHTHPLTYSLSFMLAYASHLCADPFSFFMESH